MILLGKVAREYSTGRLVHESMLDVLEVLCICTCVPVLSPLSYLEHSAVLVIGRLCVYNLMELLDIVGTPFCVLGSRASGANIDSLFICGGIHAKDVELSGERFDESKLDDLCSSHGAVPTFVSAYFQV